MSESGPEGSVGDTGEAGAPGGLGADPAADDQEAEELLHGIMQEEDPEMLKKQLQHWRQTAQRNEKTARENSSAARKLREMEDANKTELQKAVEAQQAAERERDAAMSQQARMMAAAAHDLDPDLIDYLGDGTADEINARAEQLSGIIEQSARKLIEQLGQQNGGRVPAGTRQGRPIESMRPGAAPAGTAPSTHDDMLREMLRRNRN